MSLTRFFPAKSALLSRVFLAGWLVLVCKLWLTAPVSPVYWDENYHLSSAEKYLGKIMFMEPHPPLGKLVLAFGMHLKNANSGMDRSVFYKADHVSDIPRNYSPYGGRIISAVCGLAGGLFLAGIFFLILRSLPAALVFASFYLFDNGLLVQCRAAMLEGIQLLFVMAAIWLFMWLFIRSRQVSVAWYGLLGLFIGLSISVKVNAAVLLLLFPAWWFRDHWDLVRERQWFPMAKAFVAKAGISCASVGLALAIPFYIHFGLGQRIEGDRSYSASSEYRMIVAKGETWNPLNFGIMLRDNLRYMRNYQTGVPALDLTKAGENGSHPINWLVGGRAISYRWDKGGSYVNYMYLVMNPIGTLAGLIGLGLALALLASVCIYGHEAKGPMMAIIPVFCGLYAFYMAAVLNSDRVLYLYHYFIPLIFSWILAAAVFKHIFPVLGSGRDAKWASGGLAVIFLQTVLSFYFFAPMTYHLPLDPNGFSARSWFDLWGFRHAN